MLRGMEMRSLWMKLLAAVISGLLVACLFPPIDVGFLVWVALMPLLAAVWSFEPKRAGWKGFLTGWLAGTVSCLVQFQWVAVVSWVGAIALPVYLGLYWGIFGAFAATLGNPRRMGGKPAPLRTAFFLAAMWAGLEWVRGWMLTGFGWNGLGVAFGETPVFAQAADLLGLTGLSMLPVFFQAVLLQSLPGLKQRRVTVALTAAASLVAIAAVYGIVRIHSERNADSTRLKTLLVQINVPQDATRMLWEPVEIHMAYENETLKGLESLGKNHPDWVLWPESALPGGFLRGPDNAWGCFPEIQHTISQIHREEPFQLLFGTTEWEAEPTPDGQLVQRDKGKAWNSIAVMSPEGELQTYRKQHLVIFGETIPFVDSLPWLKAIYEQQAGVEFTGSFTAGVSDEPLRIPTANGEMLSAIPTVCFEDSVPRLVRRSVRPESQVIVNVTNDGWFKESAAAAQHFADARFRAIELRRPMLRCANTGVSAAIDSTGSTAHPDTGKPQILTDAKGSHFTRGSLLVETKVPLRPSFSLYSRIGDWGVFGLVAIGLLWARRERKRNLGRSA
jgi:apolipoprotein N-acyltransferase